MSGAAASTSQSSESEVPRLPERRPGDIPLPPLGTQVSGLVLEERLGRGSYGTVFRARADGGKPYAVKFLAVPRTGTWGWRELEVLVRLRHLGWVAVRGFGEWPEAKPRWLYLIMEYVEGPPLDEWAQRHNPSARLVARLGRALARQLTAVHRAGVVHRDVKCANVVVHQRDGWPVLVDFGLSTYPGALPLTGPLVPGTAPYRSPEAERFKRQRQPGERYEASTRDDLWALGVLLYWLLTGNYPFAVEETRDVEADARALGEAILHQPLEAPHTRNPRVPRALGEVCVRLLEKAPEARYPDALAVDTALQEVLAQAEGDGTWDEPLCLAWAPDSATTLAEQQLEPAQEQERWHRLEEYERRFPRRGEPAPLVRVAPAPAPAPPTPVSSAAPGVPTRAGARVRLMLTLALAALVSAPHSRLGPSPHPPAPAPSVPMPLKTLRPAHSEPQPTPGQEMAPGDEPPEGGPGAKSTLAPTSVPAAQVTPSQEKRVKTPRPPPLKPLSKPSPSAAPGVGTALLTCALATGCPGPTGAQVRATPLSDDCPPGAVETMEALGIDVGLVAQVRFTEASASGELTVHPGQNVTVVFEFARYPRGPEDWGKLSRDARLSGQLLFGDKRVYGRFTQAQTPNGTIHPICMELVAMEAATAAGFPSGLAKQPGSGADTATLRLIRPGLHPVERFTSPK